ncbi:MAG: hypothetical protein AAGD13_19595 [Pseudomonadota bacterium]
MKTDAVPIMIGTSSLDVVTFTAVVLVTAVLVAAIVGLRKDLAAFAFVVGVLGIALTM